MAQITDDIGVWNDLGVVSPGTDQWLKFPVTAVGSNSTLRLTFFCNNFPAVKSRLMLRPNYTTASTGDTGKVIWIRPESNRQIIEVPIPKDLFDRSVYFRDFEAKKYLRFNRYVTYDYDWSVKLEELW